MPKTATPQTYYIPAATNNPTFDAFIFPDSTGQSAIAFQMTLATSHTLKKSGLALLAQRLESATDKQFIFVVPQGRSFSLADPTHGIDAHELSIKMSFWVLEIPLSPDYHNVLWDVQRPWDADVSLQRVEMENPVNVPNDGPMED
ncbi:hypothetical protein EXIGLDRAFT_723949 [Exidia glandulosa HHB12029]|uniref:Uncharacterized protein n=1 Tax=Exidia glandulosa HHB12029 TaxID=1314781 RepID=A0A165EMB3_EXIGL|nr:hypothetical protein EXIGLDRAFT_723949 [Exidia glandulosa HHB12029]